METRTYITKKMLLLLSASVLPHLMTGHFIIFSSKGRATICWWGRWNPWYSFF